MGNSYKKGDYDLRPWGKWEVLDSTDYFCVKRITINPHSMLSLQLHHYRQEHWIFVEGKGVVTLDSDKFEMQTDNHVFIPKDMKHRIENTTDQPLCIIEIQTGEKLDEKDIIRFEDIYGRC